MNCIFTISYMIEHRPEVSDPIRVLGNFLKSTFCIVSLKTGGGNRCDESSSSMDECCKHFSWLPEMLSAQLVGSEWFNLLLLRLQQILLLLDLLFKDTIVCILLRPLLHKTGILFELLQFVFDVSSILASFVAVVDVFNFAILIRILFIDEMLCGAIVFPSIVVSLVAGSLVTTVPVKSVTVLDSIKQKYMCYLLFKQNKTEKKEKQIVSLPVLSLLSMVISSTASITTVPTSSNPSSSSTSSSSFGSSLILTVL